MLKLWRLLKVNWCSRIVGVFLLSKTMSQFVQCPKCSDKNAQQVKFTWWGGILGPKILHHVKCQTCGQSYNGKTGKDNTTNIIIYSVVILAIGFLLFGALIIGLLLVSRY